MSGYLKPLLSVLMLMAMVAACGEGEPDQKADTEQAMQAVEEKAETVADSTGEKMEQAEKAAVDAGEQVAEVAEDVTEDVTEGAEATVEAARPKTHVINAEARVFNPDIININPGDTVGWTNMTSHNTVSVEGLIPEGAKHWRSELGENLKVTLDVEGVYAYVCEPHIGFGMVGVIVVGQPTDLDAAKKYAHENLEGPYRRIIGKLIKIK